MVRTEEKPEGRAWRGAGAGLAAAFLALGITVSAAPVQAADDPILAQLAGSWVGQGKARTKPSADEELVYCKITNKLASDGKTLTQSGRCAIATNSGKIKGTIVAAGGGKYEGTMESFSTNGVANLSGSGKNDTIVFTANFTDRTTKKPQTSKITLVTGDGKYRLVSQTLDASGQPDVKTGDILFARQ